MPVLKSSSFAFAEHSPTGHHTGSSWEAGCRAGQLYKASDGVFLTLMSTIWSCHVSMICSRCRAGEGALRVLPNEVYSWSPGSIGKPCAPSMQGLLLATGGTTDSVMTILPSEVPVSWKRQFWT